MSVPGASKSGDQAHSQQITPKTDGFVHITRGHSQVVDSVILNHVDTSSFNIVMFSVPADVFIRPPDNIVLTVWKNKKKQGDHPDSPSKKVKNLVVLEQSSG
jgi:hypothetical protein